MTFDLGTCWFFVIRYSPWIKEVLTRYFRWDRIVKRWTHENRNFSFKVALLYDKLYSYHPTKPPHPQHIFCLAPRLWEPRDQPQPGSFLKRVCEGRVKTLGTRLRLLLIGSLVRTAHPPPSPQKNNLIKFAQRAALSMALGFDWLDRSLSVMCSVS